MDITYTPYIDQELELLIERIHPPRVCVDNDTSPDCTLVKVDSANKNGMLLEMVQVLTDLDLVIIKSYISSDGGWLMDVFHVTDQLGNKITDESLIHNIQEGICASKKAKPERVEEVMRPKHVMTGNMALEMTGIDRPGLMSEMSAVLAELECHITAAVAWTHNSRVACIIYVEDSDKIGAIMDSYRAAKVQARLKKVVEAHHYNDEKRSVRLTAPTPAQTHKERRLHQLLAADRDYEECCSCCDDDDDDKEQEKGCDGTHVKVENCRKMGYSIVTVRSRDRPKLLFDTVCTLTDLQYVVYHAAISSKCSTAFQEYYVKHKNGCIMETEAEKHRVIKCLIAGTKRRISHGLRLDISTSNRTGLLSEVTRAFRENGLSITRAEIGIRGEKAIGTFYVKDASGQDVNPETLEILRQEIGGSILVENNSSENTPPRTSGVQKFSLGNLLWAQLDRILGNFRLLIS